MTATMDSALSKVSTVKNWLEDHAEDSPAWKTKLIHSRLDEVLRVIDITERRQVP